jgi:hypothetical protein
LTKKQLSTMSSKERAGRQKNKLDSWVTAGAKRGRVEGDTSDQPIGLDEEDKTSKSTGSKRKASTLADDLANEEDQKRARLASEDSNVVIASETIVQCPICAHTIAEAQINDHLDTVHIS